MLLLHQVGSVKIGEVVRYTVTYNPSRDRILPSPEYLHLRIRNTSPIPLRAAFVHGPYTLHVSAYPSHFDPNVKFDNPRRYGVPEFEPMLKAGGTWTCKLTVPDNIRQSAGAGAAAGDFNNASNDGPDDEPTTATWIIEVASQVMFSSSAAVGYEVLLARDEKSFNISSVPTMGNSSQVPQPGRVSDFQQSVGAKDGHHPAQLMGVYSKAVTLEVDDTASLWNTPRLPEHSDMGHHHQQHQHQHHRNHPFVPKTLPTLSSPSLQHAEDLPPKRRRRVHMVVLTHGLHSNLGADMLYLKESIDAAAKQAKKDAKVRRAKQKEEKRGKDATDVAVELREGTDQSRTKNTDAGADEEEEDDDEEVIVRGFSGNATRTERGIKFLGKRLARYVLAMTYPDQPYLPSMKKAADGVPTSVQQDDLKSKDDGSAGGVGKASHKHSSIHRRCHAEGLDRAYQITSISFIGHSLGGLVQMYAIAYIQKHSPDFFSVIKPINFVAMASPLLGLSNENPIYVKFALDFGLVGRTGRDLGLTWRAPTIARSGWGALMGTLGESAHKKVVGESQPESKPLLRILPTGPAHTALRQFRNRTVYSNVVNDGIVPLRTACLLFLDWQGLGRVEKARREAGLVETVMGFGWAELTGANVSARRGPWKADKEEQVETPMSNSDQEDNSNDERAHRREVPQPAQNVMLEDDRQSLHLASSMRDQFGSDVDGSKSTAQTNNDYPFSGLFNFFKSADSSKSSQKSPPPTPRASRIYQRSQTLKIDEGRAQSTSPARSPVTSGHELDEEHENGPPPRTTILEAAGDLLNPVMPTNEFLLDPSRRPRTIFHDRIYHPSDIPPPPMKKRSTGLSFRRKSYQSVNSQSGSESSPPKRNNGTAVTSTEDTPHASIKYADSNLSASDYYDSKVHPKQEPDEVVDSSNMKVEEKIARAYHRDLSWRKVLVKMEPDAHNNIIVRRMFSNAHGWPVVKHLCDTHFSDAAAARMSDEAETNAERAKPLDKAPTQTGAETGAQMDGPRKQDSQSTINRQTSMARSDSENLEADDNVPDLPSHAQERDTAPHSSHGSTGSISGGGGSGTSFRPTAHRYDSATWSDRDFADSGDDSEWEEHMAYGGPTKLQPPPPAKTKGGDSRSAVSGDESPAGGGGWNWTEKIVGKSAAQKKKEKERVGSSSAPGTPGAMSPTGVEAGRSSFGFGARP